MQPITSINDSMSRTLRRFAMVTDRTFPEVMLRAGRGVIKRVMGITPPASNVSPRGRGGALTNADKQRGIKAIRRDLNTLFVPVRLKHKRKERLTGAQMVTIHQRALSRKRAGSKMRRHGAPNYVDKFKFTALRKKLESHVGRFASGWVSVAHALKVRAPAWVSRHGPTRGAVRMDLKSRDMFIEATNRAPNLPLYMHADVQRRVDAAIRYQGRAMERELQYLLKSEARKSGLTVT